VLQSPHLADADELNELRAWFSDNLERPTSFGRDTLRLGICWFKIHATSHIARIWEMVRILERNGIYVKKIKTAKPGYVIYEDEWQLVAEPFRKRTMQRRQSRPCEGDDGNFVASFRCSSVVAACAYLTEWYC